MKYPDARPSRVGYTGYMIQRTGDLTMPASRAFGVINLYPGHGSLSQKDFGVIDLVRKCDFPLYSKQILDSRCWILDQGLKICAVYPVSSDQYLATAQIARESFSENL